MSPEVGPQVDQPFSNIEAVLPEEGLGLGDIVKLTAFLTDPDDVAAFNERYRANVPEPYLARTAVVTDLVFDGKLEIEVIARANPGTEDSRSAFGATDDIVPDSPGRASADAGDITRSAPRHTKR